MKNLTQCAAAATVALLSVVFVSAQERREQDKLKSTPPATQRQPDNRVPQQPGAPFHGQAGQNQGDRQLAACLISDNEGEVALAKFALQKSENSEVKEFSEQMIQAHGEFLKKLSQFAPNATTASQDPSTLEIRRDRTVITEDRPANSTQRTKDDPQAKPDRDAKPTTNQDRDAIPQAKPDRDANSTTKPNQAPGTRVNQSTTVVTQEVTGQVDLIRVKQEIGRLCVETVKKELGAKQGADFDKCFMGMQVGGHLHMADTLKVMKNYASPQLRSVLEEGAKTTAEHLAHAKQIMKSLEGEKRTERTAAKEDE